MGSSVVHKSIQHEKGLSLLYQHSIFNQNMCKALDKKYSEISDSFNENNVVGTQ